MAIPVACACGKQLKVKDELAGKKIRCPACQAAVTVPAAAPPEPPSPGDREEAVVAPKAKLAAPVAAPTDEPTPVITASAKQPGKESPRLVLWLVLGGLVLVLGAGAAAGAIVFAMGWLAGKS